MKTKFNPKIYQGTNRIEKAVPGSTNITKLWHWNSNKQSYEVVPDSKSYIARRKRLVENKKVTERRSFHTLEQARYWQYESNPENTKHIVESKVRPSPKFLDVVANYKKLYLPTLRLGTQESYIRMLKTYFEPLYDLMISEINPIIIDQWISWLKSRKSTAKRLTFRHEYDLLSGVLKFYSDYDDDYKSPFRPRHRRNILVRTNSKAINKHITEEEFLKFRHCLLQGPDGKMFAAMATVQFYQCLRISEVNALHREDVLICSEQIEDSTVRISKAVFYSRTKGVKPAILNSFKNSKVNAGIKTQPLLKESYESLIDLVSEEKRSGLIFTDTNGELFTYRHIQYVYDLAFKLAELPYSSTHIMRHGGASYVYNNTNGDLSMVQMMTGNKDYKTALVYAHRNPIALREFSKKEWQRKKV